MLVVAVSKVVTVEFEYVVIDSSSYKIISGDMITNANEKINAGATHIILTDAIDNDKGAELIEL